MASLVVGGVTIPVAISSPAWTRSDAVDRGRLFDGTFFASEAGGATRDWNFSTTPVTQSEADTYIAALTSPAAKLCSGDILQIPTMCSPELPSGKPTRAASSNRVVLDFMLHEITPAKVLLRYAPGDTVAGESFSRSTVGSYITAAGLVASAAINVKRDSHYIGGVRSLLLEDAATNLGIRSAEFDHATWVKTAGVTVTANDNVDPAGTTTADTIHGFAHAPDSVSQNLGVDPASKSYTFSVWLAGSGTLHLRISNNVNQSIDQLVTLSGTWTRYSVSGTFNATAGALIASIISFGSDTATQANVWGAQVEQRIFATSYIATTTATVARGADSYSLPFTTPPQEMTVYAKFVEGGSITASRYLWDIASAGDANPRFLLWSNGSQYQTLHGEPSLTVTSTQAAAPVVGNVVEIAARLHGDGSVSSGQTINGAAETLSTPSVANPFPALWSAQLVWLNSAGTVSQGFTAIQAFRITGGARSLADMRAA